MKRTDLLKSSEFKTARFVASNRFKAKPLKNDGIVTTNVTIENSVNNMKQDFYYLMTLFNKW